MAKAGGISLVEMSLCHYSISPIPVRAAANRLTSVFPSLAEVSHAIRPGFDRWFRASGGMTLNQNR